MFDFGLLELNSQSPTSWLNDGGDEGGEAVPGDLDADAEQNECDDAEDSVGRGGRDLLGDPGGVGIAEIDQNAEDNHGKKYAQVRKKVMGENFVMDVCGDGEQCDERARP